ncbi:MAG: hypothetical protein MUF02_02995 [Acidobacteria bacterium]|jgi:hypothetical protein|nr:hypothetical protein [Acidobacteriota bacterium]
MKRIAVILALIGLASTPLLSQSINLKFGLFVPQMKSDLWEINMENLTFSRSDMVNTYYEAEYESFLGRYSSFSLEFGSYAKTVYAQYRDYTDMDGNPIFQNLSLRIVPIVASVKIYPLGHRHVVNPFVGLGAGIYAWTYQQWGDFINFVDDSINEGLAETRRFTVGFNGRFGLVYRFQSRVALSLEGKYQYLKGRLSDNFEDFNLLDMGGFSANVGINIFFR